MQVTQDELSDSRMPSAKYHCPQAGWNNFFEAAAKAGWPALKATLKQFCDDAILKWRK